MEIPSRVFGLLLFASSSSVLAEPTAIDSWSCSNQEAEIRCSQSACTLSESFTPMSVSFDTKGDILVCAYSGCWEGKADALLNSGSYTTLTSKNLYWSHAGSESSEPIEASITIDRSNGYATILVAGFAHPISCKS